MRAQFSIIALSVFAAIGASPAAAQTASTTWSNSSGNFKVDNGGTAFTAPTVATPQISTVVTTGVAGESSGVLVQGQGFTAYTQTAGGNTSQINTGPTGASLLYVNPTSGIAAGTIAVDGGTFTGTFNGATSSFESGLVSGATGNTLIGATQAAGITNAGNITTDTLNTTANGAIGGNLAVTGTTNTAGVVNTGNVTTDTLNTTANGAIGGNLAVTGTTNTAGVVNTGNVTTDTLNTTANGAIGGNLAVTGTTNTAGVVNTGNVTTDNAAVGGNLAVSGVASTHGLNNNGQVISGVADGVAATDAVNVGQLNTAVNNAMAPVTAAQAAVNSKVQGQLEDNRKIASTGTAMAMAAASIPALEQGKSFGMGLGGGTYDGRSAFAIGVATRINQALQLKFNVGTGNGGKVGAGAGAMWSW